MALQSEILKKAENLLKNKTIVTGGHFRIFFNENRLIENLNAGTIVSFRLAVELFLITREKDLDVSLGLLVNDMGSSCDEDGCILGGLKFSREDYELPAEYLEILKSSGLEPEVVNIFWEKHVRNRGKKELLKLIKKNSPDLIRETGGIYIRDSDGYEKIILTRTLGKDKYGTPACPLIMGGLNIMNSKEYENSINFYYTGNDNLDNIPNPHVIEKGRRVAELFGAKIDVNNIYFNRF